MNGNYCVSPNRISERSWNFEHMIVSITHVVYASVEMLHMRGNAHTP